MHTYGNNHCKGITLYYRKKRKNYIILRQCCIFFTDMCPIIIKKTWIGNPIAGHQPILSKGFEVRVKVDLFNFGSIPDGQFKHIMKHQYHGIKILISTPIIVKRGYWVVYSLMEFSRLLALPQLYSLIMEDSSVTWTDINLTVTVPLVIIFLMMLLVTSKGFGLRYEWFKVLHVALSQMVVSSAWISPWIKIRCLDEIKKFTSLVGCM